MLYLVRIIASGSSLHTSRVSSLGWGVAGLPASPSWPATGRYLVGLQGYLSYYERREILSGGLTPGQSVQGTWAVQSERRKRAAVENVRIHGCLYVYRSV